MAQKYVGLDLGTSEVKAVLINAGLRTIQVLDVVVEPVTLAPQGDTSLAAALDIGISVLRRRGWNHYPIGVVLPGSFAAYRVFKFPFNDPRRIAQAIAFEAEGQFPVPLENLELDHVPATAAGGGGQALAVAVRRSAIDQVQAAFKAATIDLKLITVDVLATAQVLTADLPEPAKGSPADARTPVVLGLDIGHATTDLVAFGAKGPVAARMLRRGGVHVTRALQQRYQLSDADAEAAKRANAFLPHRGQGDLSAEQLESATLVARALEPVVREIEHTRMWLRAEFGSEVVQLRLSGGGANLRGLDAYLAEQLGLPTERARPRESLGLKGLSGHDWTATCAALGGAVGCARRPLIQLHKDAAVQRGSDGSWIAERIATVAALGFAILAFGVVDTVVGMSALEAERLAYEEELGEASNKVFGETLTSKAEIEERLNAVDGRDITKLIPARGALDVLAGFVKAATPSGAKPPPVPVPVMGEEGTVSPESSDGSGTTPAGPTTVQLPSVDPTAGLQWDDEFVLSLIEIRPRAIQFRASATRSSAQERFKTKLLQALPCVVPFPTAKVRDEGMKKVFDPTIEHDCFASTEADS
ncbi:pilus assembly protein PilM [Nannocystis radixulma]|uniref:Pilus assembly protein PilM n=1 Tax=Nannocystis radixulma TaxID=2995305 RepID=A0ABT5BIH6_9BACT|nr:pilus assembly protein PilM [Nannocystis radixulma]MDC0673959.1 pilus assembly protein PilM [Nannocystis radixulma]